MARRGGRLPARWPLVFATAMRITPVPASRASGASCPRLLTAQLRTAESSVSVRIGRFSSPRHQPNRCPARNPPSRGARITPGVESRDRLAGCEGDCSFTWRTSEHVGRLSGLSRLQNRVVVLSDARRSARQRRQLVSCHLLSRRPSAPARYGLPSLLLQPPGATLSAALWIAVRTSSRVLCHRHACRPAPSQRGRAD